VAEVYKCFNVMIDVSSARGQGDRGESASCWEDSLPSSLILLRSCTERKRSGRIPKANPKAASRRQYPARQSGLFPTKISANKKKCISLDVSFPEFGFMQ